MSFCKEDLSNLIKYQVCMRSFFQNCQAEASVCLSDDDIAGIIGLVRLL